MSDILGISSNAINAYQVALSTVSNNIANVNTDGYSRQDVVLQDVAPKQMAGMYVGTGVMLQTIQRQYDAFAEANLRSSTSDLSAQTPMVDGSQKVIDLMGDQTMGLSSAFDSFFASANALSADPASTVQRASFLSNAGEVVSRFALLSGQLDQATTQNSQALQSTVDQVNTLTSQLAVINQNMNDSPTLQGQAPQVLDRRDLALRQLSALVRIQVSYAPNGEVSVSLGKTQNQGVVVSGATARPIGVTPSANDATTLVLDPYGKTEALPDLSGGQLGGYQTFATQVLQPAQENLNSLAQVFVKETNAIQQNGLDGYGQMGQALFSLDPAAAQPAAGIHLNLSDGMRVAAAAQFRVSEGSANVSTTQGSVTYAGSQPTTALSNSSLVNNPNPSAGVTVNVDGAQVYAPVTTLSAGVSATFYLDQMAPGQQLQVMTRDGQHLLGAPLTETQRYQMLTSANGFSENIHDSDQYLNQSGSSAYRGWDYFYGAKADVQYQPNYDRNGQALPPIALAASLTSARLTSPLAPIGANALTVNGVALGAFTPSDATGSGGVTSDVAQMVQWFNGSTQATLSGIHFGTGNPGFSAFSMNLGQVNFNLTLPATNAPTDLSSLAADLQTQLQAMDHSTNLSVTASNGQLVLTDQAGRTLKSLSLTPNSDAQGASAGQLAITQSNVSQSGVRADLFSDIRVPVGQLDFTKPLSINGVMLQHYANANDLVGDINQSVAGVNATIGADGEISIVNAQGAPITLDPVTGGNVLNLSAGTYAPQMRLTQVVRDLTIPATQLDLTQPLVLNGVTINPAPGNTWLTSRDDLVQRIGALSGQTGVTASVNGNGDVVLSTTDVAGTGDIAVGPPNNADGTSPANALGLPSMDYDVNQRLQRDLVSRPQDKDIRIGFGANGTPSDLSDLGLRTAAYIEGSAPDDLLVFVTGQGSAKVAASFSGQPVNPRDSLRSQSLVVKFTAADRYSILDSKTGTVLADRSYDPSVTNPVVGFEGLQLQLSHAPSAGDTFTIDGNQDGLGNNVNMLDMADLAKKDVANGKTLHDNYIDQINVVGNLGQQAKVNQAALQVVNTQDIAARDKVSGVSLDDEAAALIRYQQAYQAAAKALQISGQLFDTVAQIQ